MPVHYSAQSIKILEKLQSAIRNMDQQSMDEDILALNQELAMLRSQWEGQKVPLIYLQILGGLSQYIATIKGQADPGAFSLMGTVFDGLADMVVYPADEEAQTKKVMVHVDAYNQLKNALASASPYSDEEVEMAADPALVEGFVESEEVGDDVAASGGGLPQREDVFGLDDIMEKDLPGVDHTAPDQKEVSGLGVDLKISLAEEGHAEEEISGYEDVDNLHLDTSKNGEKEEGKPAAAGGFVDMGSALDDFFDEEEAGATPAARSEMPESRRGEVISETGPVAHRDELSAVAGLKALLVSMVGGLDDQLLGRLDANIAALAESLAGHEVALAHLRFVEEVVFYVARHHDQMIPEAMECLQKVMKGLEELVADNDADRSRSAVRAGAAFMQWHQWLVADLEKRLEAAHGQDNDWVGQQTKIPGTTGAIFHPQKLKQEILSEVRQMLALEMQTLRREVSARV